MSDDTEDQKWLDTLGGKVGDPGAPLEREATVIRNAMLRELQGRPTYEPSQARLDMLMAEAKKQGLLGLEARKWSLGNTINRIYEFLAMPSAVMASVALVLGLSITVGWQAEHYSATQTESQLRGETSSLFSFFRGQPDKLGPTITIFDPNPESLRSFIIEAEIQAQVPLKITYLDGIAYLQFSSLVSDSDTQLTLKVMLGLPTEAVGSYTFILAKR